MVLEVVYEMEPSKTVHRRSLSRRKQTENSSRKQPDLLRRLGKCFQKVPDSLFQNGNPRGRYDFGRISVFEDWGRDTMIALPGICISTGQFETAKRILRTFAQNERDGLMPNLFPEEETSRCTIQSMRHCCLSIACICIMKQQKIWSLSGKCIR